jgi:hypothetical protein
MTDATVKKTPNNFGDKPGPGRPKGVPNKANAELKEMILGALGGVGGQAYLEERANDPKTQSAFLALIGKVLPMTIAGDPNQPLAFTVIERRIVKTAD